MPNRDDFKHIRQEYRDKALNEGDLSTDPFQQFDAWLKAAITEGVREPNAMVLATCSNNGKPSARTVLLKEVTQDGFIFYTNYVSQKGKELSHNQQAALVFLWVDLERQIRIEGTVRKTTRETALDYFRNRPRAAQLAAYTSNQSAVIQSRADLEQAYQNNQKRFDTMDIPLPEDWGGYVVIPDRFEFWQGRSNRLHDRIQYEKCSSNTWKMSRLAP